MRVTTKKFPHYVYEKIHFVNIEKNYFKHELYFLISSWILSHAKITLWLFRLCEFILFEILLDLLYAVISFVLVYFNDYGLVTVFQIVHDFVDDLNLRGRSPGKFIMRLRWPIVNK